MNHPTVLNEKLHSVANCQGVLFCSFYSTSFTFFFPLKKSCGSSNIACSFLPRFLWGNSLKRRLLVRSRGYPLPSPSCPLLIIQPIIGCNGCDLKVPLVKGLIQRSYLDASLRVEHDLKHQGQRELAASHSEGKPWCLPASGWASMLLSIIFRRVLKSSTRCYKPAQCFALICKNAQLTPAREPAAQRASKTEQGTRSESSRGGSQAPLHTHSLFQGRLHGVKSTP